MSTEIRSAAVVSNTRAAKPGTPLMPAPCTVTRPSPPSEAVAFTTVLSRGVLEPQDRRRAVPACFEQRDRSFDGPTVAGEDRAQLALQVHGQRSATGSGELAREWHGVGADGVEREQAVQRVGRRAGQRPAEVRTGSDAQHGVLGVDGDDAAAPGLQLEEQRRFGALDAVRSRRG